MSEKNMWTHLRKKMVGGKHWTEATRHEDAYQRGIADVSFVQRSDEVNLHGWVELKFKGTAPVRPSTICKLPHFTDDQRIWLKNKGEAGGMTFLLLQLGRAWLLFDHQRCQEVGHLTSAELFETANYWSDGLNPRGLWEAINEHG
jgi:hypothetical protein